MSHLRWGRFRRIFELYFDFNHLVNLTVPIRPACLEVPDPCHLRAFGSRITRKHYARWWVSTSDTARYPSHLRDSRNGDYRGLTETLVSHPPTCTNEGCGGQEKRKGEVFIKEGEEKKMPKPTGPPRSSEQLTRSYQYCQSKTKESDIFFLPKQ